MPRPEKPSFSIYDLTKGNKRVAVAGPIRLNVGPVSAGSNPETRIVRAYFLEESVTRFEKLDRTSEFELVSLERPLSACWAKQGRSWIIGADSDGRIDFLCKIGEDDPFFYYEPS